MPALIVEVPGVAAALIAESTLIPLRCHRWGLCSILNLESAGRTFVFSRRSDCSIMDVSWTVGCNLMDLIGRAGLSCVHFLGCT